MARETPSIFAMSVAVMPFPAGARLGGGGVVDLSGTSALAPVGGGSGQPGSGALDHGVAFELSEGGHDGQHRLAHRPFGVQALGDAAESDPARCQAVDDGEHVLGVAPESVELPDREHVAFAEMVEAGIEMRAGRGRAADALVGEDAGRAGLVKSVELKRGFWSVVADPRVPDGRHSVPLSHNPVECGFDTTRL